MCYVAIRPIKRPCYIVHDVQINSFFVCGLPGGGGE